MPSLAVLLTVLFVGLKLTNYIAWSWLWVLSPLWIAAIVAVALLAVCAAFGIGIFASIQSRRKRFSYR